MKLTGSQIVIECLKEEKVNTVFGYPGGAILNIYDELYKHSSEINHILTAHEQGAAHAADGYARATGKVGVCFATSGPGATNLVTGIATAYMDSTPIVAITCNVACGLLGRDSFQEIDILGVTMPITKHNYIVKDINELAQTIKDAFYIAKTGRPGPVLIDIPKDVTAQSVEFIPNLEPNKKLLKVHVASDTRIENAAKIINEAERPFILVGGGAISAEASKEVTELAKKINAPVSTTLMGKGAFPESDPLYTGLVGMHGTKASNMGITKCDVLITIGARFSDRVTSDTSKFAKKSHVLHIDIDPAEIDKNVKTMYSVVGDAKNVLKRVLPKIESYKNTDWVEEVTGWKKEFPDQENDILTPQFIMEEIGRVSEKKAIITTEVGQHQMWASQFYEYNYPRTLITSGGLGTMGFGTGASIGAQYGVPDKRVVSIAGDGSFRMNCNELATISYYNVPVIIVIMNNQTLGMVRQWQTLFYDKRYSQTTMDRGPDFLKLADAYGIKGYRATDRASFSDVIKKAFSEKRPALIDARIDTDEFVLPMVAPGKPISKLISAIEE